MRQSSAKQVLSWDFFKVNPKEQAGQSPAGCSYPQNDLGKHSSLPLNPPSLCRVLCRRCCIHRCFAASWTSQRLDRALMRCCLSV